MENDAAYETGFNQYSDMLTSMSFETVKHLADGLGEDSYAAGARAAVNGYHEEN